MIEHTFSTKCGPYSYIIPLSLIDDDIVPAIYMSIASVTMETVLLYSNFIMYKALATV